MPGYISTDLSAWFFQVEWQSRNLRENDVGKLQEQLQGLLVGVDEYPECLSGATGTILEQVIVCAVGKALGAWHLLGCHFKHSCAVSGGVAVKDGKGVANVRASCKASSLRTRGLMHTAVDCE
jgi:hypothetical protein